MVYSLFEHDTCEDASRMYAESSCGEEFGGLFDGTDIRNGDVCWGYSYCDELKAVAFLQVDVPFLLSLADGLHVESCLGKRLIHFVAHFETIEADARSDLYDHVLSL